MTNKLRFQLALTALLVSAVLFTLFTFIPQLKAMSGADFLQGFSGGVALGAFLGVIHYSSELKRERPAA